MGSMFWTDSGAAGPVRHASSSKELWTRYLVRDIERPAARAHGRACNDGWLPITLASEVVLAANPRPASIIIMAFGCNVKLASRAALG